MKKFAIFAVVVIFFSVALVSQRSENIYHRNVSCPKYGQVKVLAREEAEHLAWCESIYHRNVSCPKHGQVTVPAAVLAREEADHLAWCDRIGHRNVGCPD
ncbi:hypothetical protein L0Y46_00985 [bacterium]|nr:hypothetical protein [bacterium]